MIKVTILFRRVLTPEEGQAALDRMAAELGDNRVQYASGNKLHIEGVTRRENAFPEWLQQELEKNDFTYNDFNLMYSRGFETMALATEFQKFFDREFRGFFKTDPERYKIIEQVELRVMDEHDELMDKDTY